MYEPTQADQEFLNEVDQGYIGYTPPEIKIVKEEADAPNWIIRKFQYMAYKEGLTYYQFLEKYKPSFDPRDWDYRGDPEQVDKE